MNYELAKELKDAGFPQKHPYWDSEVEFCPDCIEDADTGDASHCPSLSKLIEACGQDFRDLTLHSDGRWISKGGKKAFGKWRLVNGRTPEEAVARLWLALQKKV